MPDETPCTRALILSGGGARGAYQAGVWKYLDEQGWKPDLICGTSAGAINACGVGMGMSGDELTNLWYQIAPAQVYRFPVFSRLAGFLRSLFNKASDPGSLFSNEPLRAYLNEHLDVESLRRGTPEVIISAVNVSTGRLALFDHHVITPDHVVASAAIPLVFPWEALDGEYYWDGGVHLNTPLEPALVRGARQIIMVMMAPLLEMRDELPRTQRAALSRVSDFCDLASGATALRLLATVTGVDLATAEAELRTRRYVTMGEIEVAAVAPQEEMGGLSMLDFRPERAKALVALGYEDAQKQLAAFLARPGAEG